MNKLSVKKYTQQQQENSNSNETRCISSITNKQVYKIKRLKLLLVTIIKLTKNDQDRELTIDKIEEFLVNQKFIHFQIRCFIITL